MRGRRIFDVSPQGAVTKGASNNWGSAPTDSASLSRAAWTFSSQRVPDEGRASSRLRP